MRTIQLILYIAAENADVYADQPQSQTRRSYIKDKVKEISSYSVGIRIGAAIRKHKTAQDVGVICSHKRPHSRRGHWHHYWAGSQNERRLILKWTVPTYIHAGIDETVIYPVK